MMMERKPERLEVPEIPALDPLTEDLSRDPELERMFDLLKCGTLQLRPTLRANIMDLVRSASRSPWRRIWRWTISPRTLQVRPLTAALAAAALIAGILVSWPGGATETRRSTSVASTEATTRFVLVAPGATEVAVTGDFVNWDPAGVPLISQGNDGVWAVELRLEPGLYHYVFVIDGTEWRPDPNAASQVDDGFGRQNSLLLVPAQTS